MEFQMYDKLLQLPLFQGLGKNEFTQIIEKVKLHFHKYSKDAIIAREEEACKKLIFILDGEVLYEAYDPDQKYMLQETIKAPHIIEPYSLFGLKPYYSATYFASTETNVLTINKKYLLINLRLYDIFMLNYLNMLSSRAQMLNKKLWDVRIGNTYEKIISFLTLRCNTQQGPKTLYVKMEDFAEMLTDTRLNISTALNDMQDNGLIKLSRKKILVPELATLIDFCKNKKKKETNK